MRYSAVLLLPRSACYAALAVALHLMRSDAMLLHCGAIVGLKVLSVNLACRLLIGEGNDAA